VSQLVSVIDKVYTNRSLGLSQYTLTIVLHTPPQHKLFKKYFICV